MANSVLHIQRLKVANPSLHSMTAIEYRDAIILGRSFMVEMIASMEGMEPVRVRQALNMIISRGYDKKYNPTPVGISEREYSQVADSILDIQRSKVGNPSLHSMTTREYRDAIILNRNFMVETISSKKSMEPARVRQALDMVISRGYDEKYNPARAAQTRVQAQEAQAQEAQVQSCRLASIKAELVRVQA